MSCTESNAYNMRPGPKHLLEFFYRSLTSFQSSQDVFRVLCTLPHQPGCDIGGPAPRRPSSSSNGSSGSGNVRQRLVVLDSSFNPPTRAHAQMAKSALAWAGAAAVGAAAPEKKGSGDHRPMRRLMLLLAVNNADKAPKPASFPVRLGMMEGFGHAVLDELARQEGGYGDVEIDIAVTKLPFFHDKARAIAESSFYGASEKRLEQVFVVGFDTVIRIFNPKYYALPDGSSGMKAALGPFFDRARLRVTMRTDDEWGEKADQEAYVKGLEEGKLEDVGGDAAWARGVDLVEGIGDGSAVSSSKVRETVRPGKKKKKSSVEGMVDREVLGWMEREGLYKYD